MDHDYISLYITILHAVEYFTLKHDHDMHACHGLPRLFKASRGCGVDIFAVGYKST